MISICIPIYNFNVTNLVNNLSAQSELLDVTSEIVLIDDCSENYFRKANEIVCEKKVFVQLKKNIGRAAIRNQFLKYAKYDYLLFLDCDSIVFTDDFLYKYIQAIKEHSNKLICGGRIYKKLPPKKSELLRWKYGIKKESKTFDVRNKNPNKSFMTNNFVINRSIFETIKFDERLVEYGHEDTLFGFELKKRNININHINNPILNDDLRDNVNYISDTEKAIYNLTHIIEFIEYDKEFIEDVALLRTYYNLFKFRKIILGVFVVFKPIIKYVLSKGYINLYLFDFYKLGTLSRIMNDKY